MSFIRISEGTKIATNRSRNARVIVENKMACFHGLHRNYTHIFRHLFLTVSNRSGANRDTFSGVCEC